MKTTMIILFVAFLATFSACKKGCNDVNPVRPEPTPNERIGTLAEPTILTAGTDYPQFIAAGGSGANNAVKVNFKFTACGNICKITGLKFSVGGPITSITIGGQTGVPVAGIVDITGLNLSTPNDGNGINCDALISYGIIGVNGFPSQSSANVSLIEVIYKSAGVAKELRFSLPSPIMMLVGSKPIITINPTNNAGLVIGENKLMDIKIAADSHGNISLNTIVFNIAVSSATMNILNLIPRIVDENGNTIASISCSGTSTVICTMNGYVIPAGTIKRFSLRGTTSGTLGNAGTSSISVTLNKPYWFSWNDLSGAPNTTISPITGETNTSYFWNYPTEVWTIHN